MVRQHASVTIWCLPLTHHRLQAWILSSNFVILPLAEIWCVATLNNAFARFDSPSIRSAAATPEYERLRVAIGMDMFFTAVVYGVL